MASFDGEPLRLDYAEKCTIYSLVSRSAAAKEIIIMYQEPAAGSPCLGKPAAAPYSCFISSASLIPPPGKFFAQISCPRGLGQLFAESTSVGSVVGSQMSLAIFNPSLSCAVAVWPSLRTDK